MKKTLFIAASLAAGALTLTACSQPNVTVTPQASASTAPASEKPAADSWDNVVAFVEAQWNNEREEALALASPGSPAEKYANYQIASAEARQSVGESEDETKFTYVDDSDEGTVTITYPEGDSVVWRDFVVDPQGRIVSWTGESGPLEDALWTKDAEVHANGATVELVGAYEANSGNLFIVLDTKAGKHDVTVAGDAYVVKGRSHTPEYGGYSEVPAGTSGYMILTFPGSKLGGTLKIEVGDNETYDSVKVSLDIE